jgi:predicted permease
MGNMINELVNVVTPVFIIIAMGYLWSKAGQRYDLELVTSLLINIGCPCLAFSTLINIRIDYFLLGQMGLYTVIAVTLFGLIGLVILRLAGLSPNDYLSPLMFANIGNMGLPVCLFSYGNEGLALAIIVFAAVSVGQFTIGIWLYSGSFEYSGLIKNPVIISIIVSLIVLITGMKPPGWILKPIKMLGEITIPMMLLTLGVSLAGMKVLNIRRAVLLSLTRIVMGFAVGLIIAYLMGLTGAVRGVLVLQCSMPVAVFNYLLAERYKRKSEETAELIVVSTLISLIGIPLILIFLKS